MALKRSYVAFFSGRAKALVERSISPVRHPVEAIAVALSIHGSPRKDRVHGIRLPIGHWLSLVEFVWKFDHRIQLRIIEKKPFRPPFRPNLTRAARRLKVYRSNEGG
jgi:hypothetical protein